MTKLHEHHKHHHHRNPLENYLTKIVCYHYWVYAVVFTSIIILIMHILNLIFLSPPMDFECSGMDQESSLNNCPCKEPIWNTSVFTSTMQTKFGIYCENSWLIQFGHSIAYFGQLCGCLSFGFLSDRYGRLNLYSISCLLISLFGCLIAVMPTSSAFFFMRFFEGLGVGGCMVTSYVLCIEYVGAGHREIVTALYHIPINIGHILVAGVSYLLRDMDDFQVAISVPMFFFVFAKWLLMESPKWLMDNDYIDEVAQGLQRLTSLVYSYFIYLLHYCTTGVALLKIVIKLYFRKGVEEIKIDIERYKTRMGLKNKRQRIQFWHIFKYKKLTINFGCMACIYFVCGLGYYGVSQFIGNMDGNIHLNVSLSGLLLVPGTLVCVFVLKLLSRRIFMTVTVFLSGISMLGVMLMPEAYKWYRVPFACVANCFFFMSFIIAFLYGVELFPTSVRNSVLGLLSVMARIGQIAAPPVNSLSEVAAASIYFTCAILCGFLCLPLPETKDSELPSTLDETRRLSFRKHISDNITEESEASTSAGKFGAK